MGAATTDNSLTAIAGTAATGLWAVGWRESPTGLQPLILRYDTTQPSPTWVSVTGAVGVPAPPGTIDTVLTGVDVLSASDVWAVGYYFDGGVNRPLALHWDGSTWTNSPVPGAGMLRKVRALAPDNVWAAGTFYNGSIYQSLVEHFDGTAWTTGGLGQRPGGRHRDHRPCGRPGWVDAHPGGPGRAPRRSSNRRAARRAPLARLPGHRRRSSACRPFRASARRRTRRRRRPRRTTAIPVTITDQAAGGGHQRPAGLDLQRGRCRFQRGWLAGHLHRAPLASGRPVAQQSRRHVHPVRCELLQLQSRTGTTARPPISTRTACEDMFCSVGADRGSAAESKCAVHPAA